MNKLSRKKIKAKMIKKIKKNKNEAKNLNELYKHAEVFFRALDEKEKLAVIHDSDPDGVCAAAITVIALRRMGLRPSIILPTDPYTIKTEGMHSKKYKHAIFLDMSPDLYKADLQKLRNMERRFLIFDHHLVWKINARNIFYINPRVTQKDLYIPTSYLVYRFFSRYVNLADVEWIATIGTIADYGIKDTKDLLDKYLKRREYENVWRSKYGLFAIVLNASIAINGAEKSLNELLRTKGYRQFRKNRFFKSAIKQFGREFRKGEKEMMKRMENFPKIGLRMSFVSPKYRRISSALATKWGMMKKNSVLVILERSGEVYKIHGRSSSKISIGKIFQKLGIGGGHHASGGANIKVKDLQKFKKMLIREIGTERYKNKK